MTESFRNLKLSHIEPIYLIRVCLRDLWMVILASLCCAMLTGTILILFFPDVIYFLLRVDKSILLIIRISCCGFALIPRLPRVRC